MGSDVELFPCLTLSDNTGNTAMLLLATPNFTSGMNVPLSDISYHRAEEAGLCKITPFIT